MDFELKLKVVCYCSYYITMVYMLFIYVQPLLLAKILSLLLLNISVEWRISVIFDYFHI